MLRDRAWTVVPKLIAKYQRRFPDFDDKIISLRIPTKPAMHSNLKPAAIPK